MSSPAQRLAQEVRETPDRPDHADPQSPLRSSQSPGSIRDPFAPMGATESRRLSSRQLQPSSRRTTLRTRIAHDFATPAVRRRPVTPAQASTHFLPKASATTGTGPTGATGLAAPSHAAVPNNAPRPAATQANSVLCKAAPPLVVAPLRKALVHKTCPAPRSSSICLQRQPSRSSSDREPKLVATVFRLVFAAIRPPNGLPFSCKPAAESASRFYTKSLRRDCCNGFMTARPLQRDRGRCQTVNHL